MKIPGIPLQEAQRLAALVRCAVLDTPPETAYDELTRMAAAICGMPVSLISLVDERRQWFKSAYGAEVRETPREHSFCGHLIADSMEMLVVPDAREDERFHDNPVVTGPLQVIFYAGIPLVSQDGFTLGTLCVIDHRPNALSELQLQSLKVLARYVSTLLELRRSHAELMALASGQEALEAGRSAHTRALQEENEGLTQTNRELEHFLYAASHDLQEPLRKISVFADLLKKMDIPDQAVDYAGRITVNAGRMLQLLQGILRYSAVRHISYLEEVDLNHVLETVCADYELLIQEKSAVVDCLQPLPVMRGNAMQLQQLFANLISNALKFCTETPRIEIGHYPDPDGSGRVCLTFRDNGIGFEQQYADRVFTLFQRLNDRQQFQGTGIGLALCKKVAENHGGAIRAESEVGKGTLFTVQLPLQGQDA